MDPNANPFFPMREPPMAQANVVEDDDVIGPSRGVGLLTEVALDSGMKRLKEISGVHAVGCSLLLARIRIRCGENRRDHERGRPQANYARNFWRRQSVRDECGP